MAFPLSVSGTDAGYRDGAAETQPAPMAAI